MEDAPTTPAEHPIPECVTRAQLADACIAFFNALGVPNGAMLSMFPLVVTEDTVLFPAVASPDYAEEYPEAVKALSHPQGDEFACLAVNVRIEVVG